ncbi:zinc finger 541 [Pelobates cultripes]|uniref:Zinc finger 541 n=1 Tax=Pelobates cultripes TaxID=61616 RepID=A0AAD1WMS0_PELCU|nr:zinc finger 541 [Pelobates cultripes]
MLFISDPQELLPHSLADYHYAGSDLWTVSERRMFSRASSVHGKNFSSIQRLIPSKNVYQCIEYYYTFKKRIKSYNRPTPTEENSASRGQCDRPCNKNNLPRVVLEGQPKSTNNTSIMGLKACRCAIPSRAQVNWGHGVRAFP